MMMGDDGQVTMGDGDDDDDGRRRRTGDGDDDDGDAAGRCDGDGAAMGHYGSAYCWLCCPLPCILPALNHGLVLLAFAIEPRSAVDVALVLGPAAAHRRAGVAMVLSQAMSS